MSTYSTYSDEQLLRLIASNDDQAFGIIYERYWSKVYNHAFTYFNSSAAAKDTVQDIFLKLWDRRSLLVNVSNFDSYLFIMSRNKILSTLKQTIKFAELTTIAESYEITAADADQAIIHHQAEQQLNNAVSHLPARQQQVYRLSREAGLTYTQIAEQLNIDRFTVKNHLVRALGTLRHLLTSHLFSWTCFLLSANFLR